MITPPVSFVSEPFTSSVTHAQRLLANIPVGGKTPLSAGLFTAYRLFEAALRRDPGEIEPLRIVGRLRARALLLVDEHQALTGGPGGIGRHAIRLLPGSQRGGSPFAFPVDVSSAPSARQPIGTAR